MACLFELTVAKKNINIQCACSTKTYWHNTRVSACVVNLFLYKEGHWLVCCMSLGRFWRTVHIGSGRVLVLTWSTAFFLECLNWIVIIVLRGWAPSFWSTWVHEFYKMWEVLTLHTHTNVFHILLLKHCWRHVTDVSVKQAEKISGQIEIRSTGYFTRCNQMTSRSLQPGLERNQPQPHFFIPFCAFVLHPLVVFFGSTKVQNNMP